MHLETQIAKAASRGLHDTAQPLTVLQGVLELALEQARTVEECREALASALSEAARVTACFEHVRQLVRLQQPASDVCDFALEEAVQEVAGSLPGVKVVENPAKDVLVRASRGRVRQALSLLMSAVALNGPQEIRISIMVSQNELAVQLSFLGDFDSLASDLEMAHLVAASAGCEIRFSETFDSVALILPEAKILKPADQKGTLTHV
jgi:signal transduction histidine kinase